MKRSWTLRYLYPISSVPRGTRKNGEGYVLQIGFMSKSTDFFPLHSSGGQRARLRLPGKRLGNPS